MDNNQLKEQTSPAPVIERIRHDTRRRTLMVESVIDITPGMRRIELTGGDLADFTSLAPDDHIKIFVPATDGGEERRDYTPRRYDNAERRLTIDFALHEAGPVTQWAIDARPGDRLEIGGPRGSAVVSKTVKRWLLIGDETALLKQSAAGSRRAVPEPSSPQSQPSPARWKSRSSRHQPNCTSTGRIGLSRRQRMPQRC